MTYDIQFTIFRDELEIGFGGCTGSTIDQALHDVESVIRRREWETTGLRVVVPPGEESDDLRDKPRGHIIDTDRGKVLVDSGGVAYLREGADGWEPTIAGASWGVWVTLAQVILSADEALQ